jgi:hypothetical protein
VRSGYIILSTIHIQNQQSNSLIHLKSLASMNKNNDKYFHPDFKSLCELLNEHKVEYLVIGAWAGIIYGLPRTTLDVDIYINNTTENCVKLIEVLSNVGAGIARELIPEDILKRKVFLFADNIRIDVFTETYGIRNYKEAIKRVNIINFENVKIPVVSYEDLLKTKKTDRPKDKRDLELLIQANKKPK